MSPPPNAIVGGGANVFPDDSDMNTAFNLLDGSAQAKILQLPPEQRIIVMKQIMLKSGRQTAIQTGGEQVNSPSPLTKYFSNLPLGTQINALQDGYKSVSTQFKQLAGSVESPTVTIVKPKSIDEEFSEQFPLLSVKSNTDTNNNNNNNNNADNGSINNNNNNNSDSSNDTKKTVVFKI